MLLGMEAMHKVTFFMNLDIFECGTYGCVVVRITAILFGHGSTGTTRAMLANEAIFR